MLQGFFVLVVVIFVVFVAFVKPILFKTSSWGYMGCIKQIPYTCFSMYILHICIYTYVKKNKKKKKQKKKLCLVIAQDMVVILFFINRIFRVVPRFFFLSFCWREI